MNMVEDLLPKLFRQHLVRKLDAIRGVHHLGCEQGPISSLFLSPVLVSYSRVTTLTTNRFLQSSRTDDRACAIEHQRYHGFDPVGVRCRTGMHSVEISSELLGLLVL
ncbi:uncharacterized protein LOC141912020 [Tubulanus polymorphus]|uniref:uncharacterized protein LOC141912020 n=1 Tax=Tubulanus polymorphus TaxID=672921 RepID=UPI003DA2F1FA